MVKHSGSKGEHSKACCYRCPEGVRLMEDDLLFRFNKTVSFSGQIVGAFNYFQQVLSATKLRNKYLTDEGNKQLQPVEIFAR